jgi:hypothetical protein
VAHTKLSLKMFKLNRCKCFKQVIDSTIHFETDFGTGMQVTTRRARFDSDELIGTCQWAELL